MPSIDMGNADGGFGAMGTREIERVRREEVATAEACTCQDCTREDCTCKEHRGARSLQSEVHRNLEPV